MSNAEGRETIYVVQKNHPTLGSVCGERSLELEYDLGYYLTEEAALEAIAARELPTYDDVAIKLNCTVGPLRNSDWDTETWYEVWDLEAGPTK